MEPASHSRRPVTRPLPLPGTAGLTLHELHYPAGLELPTHAHAGALVCVVLRGGFEERSGHSRLEAGRGTLTLQPPGESHCNRVGTRGLHGLRLEVAPSRLASWPWLEAARPTLVRGRGGWFARALLDEAAFGAGAIPAAVESLAVLVLSVLVPRPGLALRKEPRWLRRVRERLEEEYTRVPSLAELARDAGVHPAHLARAFSRFHHSTVGEFVRERRLAAARELLSTSRLPLADIAARCGFADQSHLGRAFRRRFGTTPGALRRERT